MGGKWLEMERGDRMMMSLGVASPSQNLDQWTMRQSSLELQLMIKQTPNNVSWHLALSVPCSLPAPCVRGVGYHRRTCVLWNFRFLS